MSGRALGMLGALGAAGLVVSACSAGPEPVRTGGSERPAPASSVAASASSAALPEQSPHRRALGVAVEEALAVELSPMAGGARVLAVAEDGERAAWARTIDEAGALGRARRFEGAHVVTAFDGGDGRTTFVTSNGDELCVTTFGRDAEVAEARGCHALRPEVVVPIGDRLALLSLDISEPKMKLVAAPKPAAAPTKNAAGKKGRVKATGSARDAKGGSAKTKPGDAKGASAKRGGSKPASAKKTTKKKRKGADLVKVPAGKAKVGVRVAWVSRDGALEPGGGAASGLVFERPLAGMTLIDAAPRGAGADLLFYEAVSKPKKPWKTAYGSARLGVASLGADGMLVAGSRAELAEGDLEYGYITGQHGPRLVSSDQGTVLVSFASRGGACRAQRVLPSLGVRVPSKAGCLVDPVGWALGGGEAPEAKAAAERLLAAEPRRAPGQTRADAPLVVWAGDRGVFWGAGGMGAAPRAVAVPPAAAASNGTSATIAPSATVASSAPGASGTNAAIAPSASAPPAASLARSATVASSASLAPSALGTVAAPFVGKRARLMWSAFAPDGEGIARVGGAVYRIDAAGAVSEVASVAGLEDTGSHGRRRAARIGDGWWLADGDVVRLSPSGLKVDALAGRAHPDATALVGGRERGVFVEVASGVLRSTFVGADGAITAGPSTASPVRAGLAATERAAGGAIVAGVSAQDPTKVSAFTIDAAGKLGATRATSLAVTAGTFAVRLVALPAGGALLLDHDRRRAVWLDDDANERAAGALPAERAEASCLDGRAAEVTVPSVEPGKLVRVAELAKVGTCVVGDVAWTASGALRWFGASARGLDSIAEVGALDAGSGDGGGARGAEGAAPSKEEPRNGPNRTTPDGSSSPPQNSASAGGSSTAAPAGGSGGSPAAAPASVRAVCPVDMVSIAGRFCVDRFESMLVDAKTGRVLSPDYPPTPNLLEIVLGDWATDRAHWGDVHARAFPLPAVPSWQRGAKTEPTAVARFGARPNGYATGLVAEAACAAAGKRLCSLDEFTTACRGEGDTDFPYGSDYQDGVCNVFREDHPAALLHHNASLGHLDPRLNRVRAKGRPLFEASGARPACRSKWGSDAVYDLVGNLDEWIDEGTGAFAGGFYSRSTRAGCDAVITAHPKAYADYSTGVRCCKSADE